VDCPQALENLSAHLDDALDSSTRVDLEAHLRTCGSCRSELDALRACVEAVSSLDRISAPPGFLADVHERIREGSAWSRFIKKLMIPWHVKLPLHAAGAVAAVVLIILMVPTRETAKRSLQAPPQMTLQVPPEKPAPAPEPVAQLAQGGPEADGVTTGKVASESLPAGHGDAVIELVLLMEPDRHGSTARPDQSLQRPPQPEAQEAAGARTAKPASLSGAKDTESPRTDAKLPDMPESRGKEETAARARLQDRGRLAQQAPWDEPHGVRDSRAPVSQVEEIIRRAGGTVSSTEDDPATGIPPSILVLIPSANYQDLVSLLREKGRLEGPSPDLSLHGHEGTLRVRIRVESSLK
jgi:hypothetical protein